MTNEYYNREIYPLVNDVTLWHLKIQQLRNKLEENEILPSGVCNGFEKAKDTLLNKLIEKNTPHIQELLNIKAITLDI